MLNVSSVVDVTGKALGTSSFAIMIIGNGASTHNCSVLFHPSEVLPHLCLCFASFAPPPLLHTHALTISVVFTEGIL